MMSLRQNIDSDLEKTYQVLSYEMLHDMVLLISKFDVGVHNFLP
jgi:hypothetical protein